MKNKSLNRIDEISKICSDCGNCLHLCPVYNIELKEPNSARGKVNIIKNIMSGDLLLNSINKTFIYQCVLCGSCQYLCTKGVDFIDLMIEFRNYLSKGNRIPVYKKI